VGVSLAAVADDGDLLALERRERRVAVVVDVHDAARSFSLPSAARTRVPRNIATLPVRTISRMPIGFSSSMSALILSSVPVTSATDRPSMLNPRPLKSPATRARTPNSFSTSTEMVCRIGSVRAVTGQYLHDLVLARELELLQPLLLDLLLRGEVQLLLVGGEAPFEIDMLLVVAFELGLALQQRLDQLLVLLLHRVNTLLSA